MRVPSALPYPRAIPAPTPGSADPGGDPGGVATARRPAAGSAGRRP
jgi:hypothetical protein